MGTTISSIDNSFSLADYAAIKNGSYKKLMRSYYKQEEEEKAAAAPGDSDTKDVLMNASWLTKMTASNGRTLAKAGITIGKDNKLSVDEDALKESISTVKLLFKGYNSFADKASSKAEGISNSAARAASNKASAYDKHGSYTNPLASSVKDQVDSALGSGKSGSDNTSKTTANTDKVDKEIKELKSRRENIKQKLKNEYDTEKRREYEKELKQIENELAVKDSDNYRKQNAQYVTF